MNQPVFHPVDPNLLRGDPRQLDAILSARHSQPHSVLGAHPAEFDGRQGIVVRAYVPDAVQAWLVLAGLDAFTMVPLGAGVFALFLVEASQPLRYRLRFQLANGMQFERGDPYRFLPTLGDMDLHLFNEGTHRRLWEVLGAHPRTLDGESGTSFALWAPNAQRVSVVGDFNAWDGRALPMRSLGSSGVWELFVPGVAVGALYKFELLTREGWLREKTDPMAYAMEAPPAQASRVTESEYVWGDEDWMTRRPGRDWLREPVTVYEVHLGSWARVPEQGNRTLTYREIAPRLAEHCRRLGFTHVEFMPLAEHAYTPSWGYQVTGYFAPTARYGGPDDLRYLVDTLHQAGIGVIVDWVPAHFPKDDFALRRFDGTALYEHDDWRRGEHPDWGTLIFNYGRPEVRNFLVANALYWLQQYHLDGLRVDAVASMLYLDYSRRSGEWIPNPYGGRENIDAIDFLRHVNQAILEESPGAFTVAEESTAWGGVSHPTSWGGLGFAFKWNMGWMHDTLFFFTREPVHRKYHIDQLTFSMMYEHTERFINSISHDEVVHGKGSLYGKMPGDHWQKMANLRLLMTYQYTRPGKQLIFMGSEFAQPNEWCVEHSLDWHWAREASREAHLSFIAALGRAYGCYSQFWKGDPSPESFEWVDFNDRDNTVISYLRRDGANLAVVVFNFTPVPRVAYRLGAPEAGAWVCLINTDEAQYGGSGYAPIDVVHTEAVGAHGRPQSFSLTLPPLGALVLIPERCRVREPSPTPTVQDETTEEAVVPTLPTGWVRSK